MGRENQWRRGQGERQRESFELKVTGGGLGRQGGSKRRGEKVLPARG